MRNWFKKTFEKKPASPKSGEEQEKDHTISSLYEIVEDHLKSLDHDQLKGISGDFAERFAAHREIISEIVKTATPRGKRGLAAVHAADDPDDFVMIDARTRGATGLPMHGAAGDHPDEIILSHYDRMIRSQYDRLIDLTMDFLRGVTDAEIGRLNAETARIASAVGELRDALTGQIEQLDEDLENTRQLHHNLIFSLEKRIVEQNRRADLAWRRIKILIGAVIGAGLVGAVALVLSLIR
jgi:hypothetical protein